MDQNERKFKHKCLYHPNFKVEFLQVENFEENKKYQTLFYCYDCAENDPNFKFTNYQLIKHIIHSESDQIHQKWPPINHTKLLNSLIEMQNNKEKNQQMIVEIKTFCRDLKRDMIQQIDIYEKKMIQQAIDIPQKHAQILNKYTELSKIQELKSVLIDNKTDIHEKERQYRMLIENIKSQKQSITEQLASLLDQQFIFNSESALLIKQSILKNISSISFFQHNKIQSENQNSNQKKLDVQLMATNYNNGQNYQKISINENNQYQLTINKERQLFLNTVSNLILSEESKYIFRIQIEMINENDSCFIGLMQDCNINDESGFFENMECCLFNKNKQILSYTFIIVGISNLMKGKEFRLSKENVIEMRVCLKEQILEILDYPNYHNKLVIQDQYKSNLIKKKDLRLYLGMKHLNNKMILKDAFIVKQFE